MDDENNSMTFNELINQVKASPLSIKTIHLLTDDLDKFIIAITWSDGNESHFKMFKKLEHSKVVAFNNFLSTYNSEWHKKIVKWLENYPKIPLKLNA